MLRVLHTACTHCLTEMMLQLQRIKPVSGCQQAKQNEARAHAYTAIDSSNCTHIEVPATETVVLPMQAFTNSVHGGQTCMPGQALQQFTGRLRLVGHSEHTESTVMTPKTARQWYTELCDSRNAQPESMCAKYSRSYLDEYNGQKPVAMMPVAMGPIKL